MKNGSLSATNGKVDHVEMVRCFGEPSLTKEPEEMQLEVLRKRADMLQGQVDLLERFLAQEKEARGGPGISDSLLSGKMA